MHCELGDFHQFRFGDHQIVSLELLLLHSKVDGLITPSAHQTPGIGSGNHSEGRDGAEKTGCRADGQNP
jgi:hypothetical protein